MLKSLLVVGLVAASSNVLAQSNTDKFYAADSSIDSQICLTAAEQGFSAARKFANTNGLYISRFDTNFYCNGQPIDKFAAKFAKAKSVAVVNNAKVAFYAADSKVESNLCVKALHEGINSLKTNRQLKSLQCNGVKIEQFIKRNSDKVAI
ncbi:exonuclease III [Pseudoalteromonas tunicata]|uniref:exonuclease III n=1 Tax=Pseudoalteromonas tunicata TaxID=314281 RepID=UPI00273DF3B4|nr:exonuclease III [Pseudoalteromonas tunicata]MDP5214439.1 exonuclease III [Pseudoalteromonas tunicata]